LFESSLHGILQAMPDGSISMPTRGVQAVPADAGRIRQRGAPAWWTAMTRGFISWLRRRRLSSGLWGEVSMHRGDGSQFECELSLWADFHARRPACNNLFA
jgi:hypothetical protein